MTQPIRRKGKTAWAPAVESPPADQMALYRRIAELAYQRFLERSRIHEHEFWGHDLEDWLEAERTVLAGLRVKRRDTQSRPPSSRRSKVSIEVSGGGASGGASGDEADTPRRS